MFCLFGPQCHCPPQKKRARVSLSGNCFPTTSLFLFYCSLFVVTCFYDTLTIFLRFSYDSPTLFTPFGSPIDIIKKRDCIVAVPLRKALVLPKLIERATRVHAEYVSQALMVPNTNNDSTHTRIYVYKELAGYTYPEDILCCNVLTSL